MQKLAKWCIKVIQGLWYWHQSQEVCNFLSVNQGHHLGGRWLEGSVDPQEFMILIFFLVNCICKWCYCCKNNMLRRVRPPKHPVITETPTMTHWYVSTVVNSNFWQPLLEKNCRFFRKKTATHA